MTTLATVNIAGQIISRAADISALALQIGNDTLSRWSFPVGTDEDPTHTWYAYTRHDLTGRRNPSQYKHTGLDLNLDKAPHGNVDVGQPVFAVADGEVVESGWSDNYRYGVVMKVDHFGVPLYVRYWHLQIPETAPHLQEETIRRGDLLGYIDYYPSGYAHLHFDMAWQPFKVNWWWSNHPEIEWTNPTYILKAHLDSDAVDAMLRRGDAS